MPDKSRRKRVKQPTHRKKKGRVSRTGLPVSQPAVAQTEQPVSRPDVPAPPVSTTAPAVKTAEVRHPYIAAELRTIGILAVIMLIALTVLAVVLS
ncbi:hypothetical protein ACFLW0_06105 [Chloroflexota bacterium]